MNIKNTLAALPLFLSLTSAATARDISRIEAAEDTAYSVQIIKDSSDLARIFKTPPKEARPQVWWHWMDGNVSKEGIRKDIEWMKRNGIGGFHQFDAGGVNMPRAAKVRLPYLSDGWKDAFRFALNLADSLDMDVTIASAPGWSSTGGTWVKPEDAIKKLEWRSVDVSGGKVSVKLPELYNVVGPYQDFHTENDRIDVKPYGKDLYVIAVRRPYSDKTMNALGAQITKSDTLITVEFRKSQTIKALTLKSSAMGERPRHGAPVYGNVLECSEDGFRWRKVCGVEPTVLPYLTVDIPPTCARFFRVRGRQLESLELFTVTKVNHSEELGGFGIIHDFWKYHTPYSKDAIRTSDIIDLTGKMTEDGKLECSLPAGRWRIYRFGWSITGKINHPASPEATGLEVDKLDPDAWMRYFHTYVDLYKDAADGMLGEKGIRYLLVDSYEAGPCTWTTKMAEEFKARRGYDLLPWLPVLTGEIIGSSRMSERFLWDWRRTIGELFCENYDRIDEIVKEYGLAGRYTESHEGGRAYTGDGMDPKIKATIPMAAFWMENTPTGSTVPSAICDIRESASVSHIYGQPFVAAESFSVNGDEGRAYTYCPENMKYIADVGLSAGVNRFVIHESASQPNDKYLPGLQLFRYGQWLHRNETWGEYAWVLTDYLARSSALLQQGTYVADILLYYGEDLNITALYGGDSFSTLPKIPDGYNYDFANPTVLRTGLKVENGRLVTPSGAGYRVLWMDRNCEVMSLDILKKIKEFADSGVIICGKEPVGCAGLKADDRAFSEIVDDIWHSGRKNVFSGNIGDCLRESGIGPDVLTEISKATKPVETVYGVEAPANAPDSYGDFKYVHRTLADSTQIYWVRNFSGKDSEVKFRFRDGGKFAAIFNPENGEVTDAVVETVDGRFSVSVPLLASDARFVVFSEKQQISVVDTVIVGRLDSAEGGSGASTGSATEQNDTTAKTIGIATDPIDTAAKPLGNETEPIDTAEKTLGSATEQIGTAEEPIDAKAETLNATAEAGVPVIIPVTSAWDVHFEQKNGGTADETFTELTSWTEKENPVVKYFSGTASYRTTVAIDSTLLARDAGIFIDLGSVKNIADITVNGEPAGVLWKAPFRTGDICALLREGENSIEVKVTNVWRNRMIGDVQPGEKNPVTAIRRFYKADAPLLPSGLLGPVRIIAE